MGKEADRVGVSRPPSGAHDVQRLESEVEKSRRRLDAYVDELDRRRHRLLAMRKPGRVAVAAAGAGLILGAAAFVLYRRRRRLSRMRRRGRNLQDALLRMARHPERVASDGKSPWSRVLVAVAPVVVRTLAQAAWKRGDGRARQSR